MAEEKNQGRKVGEAVLNQVINDFVRPMVKGIVDQLPEGMAHFLRKMKMHHLGKLGSVIFSSVLSEKIPYGDSIKELVSEVASEFSATLEERAKGGGATKPAGASSLYRIFLDPQLIDEKIELLTAYSELVTGKTGKEQKAIESFLETMDPAEIYIFLMQEKPYRDDYIKAFVKKAEEKSLEEAIKDFKKDIIKLKESGRTVYAELLKPTLKKVDSLLGPCGLVDENLARLNERALTFRERAEAFRERHRRKNE